MKIPENHIRIQIKAKYKSMIEKYCKDNHVDFYTSKVEKADMKPYELLFVTLSPERLKEFVSFCKSEGIDISTNRGGRPTSKHKSKQINFRIDNETYDLVKEYCDAKEITVTQFMDTYIFDSFVSKNKRVNIETLYENKRLYESLEEMRKNINSLSHHMKGIDDELSVEPSRVAVEKPQKENPRSVTKDLSSNLGVFIYQLSEKRYFSHAVATVVFLALLFIIIPDMPESKQTNATTINEPSTTDDNEILLRQADGSIKQLSQISSTALTDEEGNVVGEYQDGRIQYSAGSTNALEYNELIIPYGKQFHLVLSDGTGVYLNAGSTLKYPISFIKGQTRDVYLKGEAFFDVKRKSETETFRVHAGEMDIRVLGTSFNVSYYEEDPDISTVLVEGKVEVFSADETSEETPLAVLVPGQKATLYKGKKGVDVKPVNINMYTAWRNGEIQFKNSSFQNIKLKLERRFDVEIINEATELGEEKFTASFFKAESLETILTYFSRIHGFEFKQVNNQFIIY